MRKKSTPKFKRTIFHAVEKIGNATKTIVKTGAIMISTAFISRAFNSYFDSKRKDNKPNE